MKKLTTPEEIKEEIVKMLQKEKVYRKGKLPITVKDLTKRQSMPSYVNTKGERIENKYWTKARTKISNSKRPKRIGVTIHTATPAQAFSRETMLQNKVAPQKERAQTNKTWCKNYITVTLPKDMSATDLIELASTIHKSGAKCNF